ncbi:MAG: LPS assembly lipoprotein LptE [Azoarcus sp.]|jgi:LPS-assembly lipoprotein|nr:LPS assembly lipoprotein LptE [Azoarcus sp.]
MTPSLARLARPFLAALALATLAAGCGFHLRGPQPLAFATAYVGASQYSELGMALRRQIALSGATKIEEDAKAADVQLQILSNKRTREILSLTATGKVREYELGQTLRFRLVDRDNKELIPPTSLSVRREYTFSDEMILGKSQEEELLYRDMESDLVGQLMRRLVAWRPEQPSEPQPEQPSEPPSEQP